jgi:hypothetical protein
MLASGQITTVDEFCAHVRQVWHNAFRYNPFTNPVFKMARDLAERFENEMVKIRYPHGVPGRGGAAGRGRGAGRGRRGRAPGSALSAAASARAMAASSSSAAAAVTPSARGPRSKMAIPPESVRPPPINPHELSQRVGQLLPGYVCC